MSTRGTIAFTVDGETKGSYNHSDSYPTWLGNRVLEFLQGMDIEEVRRQARELTPVPGRHPNRAEIAQLKPYTDLGVSDQSTKDWYCLLRGTQGSPALILKAGLYEPFPVGEERYSYVVDLDKEVLEIYEGDDKEATIPFARLPKMFATDYDYKEVAGEI